MNNSNTVKQAGDTRMTSHYTKGKTTTFSSWDYLWMRQTGKTITEGG